MHVFGPIVLTGLYVGTCFLVRKQGFKKQGVARIAHACLFWFAIFITPLVLLYTLLSANTNSNRTYHSNSSQLSEVITGDTSDEDDAIRHGKTPRSPH